MGYTTKFKGQFDLSAVPTSDVIIKLRELEGAYGCALKGSWPDSYCHWELTKDCQHIKWDGGEKFYNYLEWLQAIIDRILKPAGLGMTGSVQYSGEDTDDFGVLYVLYGKVLHKNLELVDDDLKELSEFKAFVLASDYASELLSEWRRRKNR